MMQTIVIFTTILMMQTSLVFINVSISLIFDFKNRFASNCLFMRRQKGECPNVIFRKSCYFILNCLYIIGRLRIMMKGTKIVIRNIIRDKI